MQAKRALVFEHIAKAERPLMVQSRHSARLFPAFMQQTKLVSHSQTVPECRFSGMEAPDDIRAGYSGLTAPYARRSRLLTDILRYPPTFLPS